MTRDIPPIQMTHRFTIRNASDNEVATLEVERRHGVLLVQNLWVHGDHRTGGWGSALMQHAISAFGYEDMYLYALSYTDRPLGDAGLLAWYEEFGFVRVDGFPGGMCRPACKE